MWEANKAVERTYYPSLSPEDLKNILQGSKIYCKLQSVTKIIETHYIFMKKFSKNVRLAQRYPEFSLPLVQCCAKSGKAMSGSGGQE